jgi:hypothetical protein
MMPGDMTLVDLVDPTDSFALPSELWEDGAPEDPRCIAADLVLNDPHHAHMQHADAVIFFVMRAEPKVKGGRMELGSLRLPPNEPLARWLLARYCGGLPDFIMTLDLTWWRDASPQARVALVDHELTHAMIATNQHGEERFDETGRPIWAIQSHDLEEFNRIVAKYGAWSDDIQQFLRAAGSNRL